MNEFLKTIGLVAAAAFTAAIAWKAGEHVADYATDWVDDLLDADTEI